MLLFFLQIDERVDVLFDIKEDIFACKGLTFIFSQVAVYQMSESSGTNGVVNSGKPLN